jgi:glutaredoxin
MASQIVKLFALSTCSHCKDVKELLERYKRQVDVVNVDRLDKENRDAVLKEVKRYNPRVTFPTTVIGDEVIVGFKADRIKKALERE